MRPWRIHLSKHSVEPTAVASLVAGTARLDDRGLEVQYPLLEDVDFIGSRRKRINLA